MIVKTLANLIDDVQFRANTLNGSPFGATPTRITGLLNERLQELYDLILSVDNSYYTKKYTFSLPDAVLQALYTAQNLGTAPVNVSACPDGYYKDVGMDMSPTLPTPITCHNFNFPERNTGGGSYQRGGSWHNYRPVGRQAGVQVLEHLCGTSSQNTSGDYLLWFVPHAPVLAPVTIVDMTTGTNSVVSSTLTWTLANASFTAADVGTSIVVLDAANAGNNGTFLITAVTSSTVIITGTATGLVDETFATSVLVSYQAGGTSNQLDDIMVIWNKYLSVGAAMELLGIEESDESASGREMAAIRQRVLNMAANRTSEPECAPIVESFGGSYYGSDYSGDDFNT